MLLESLTEDGIEKIFPEAYFSRGYDYYLENRVSDLRIEKTSKKEIITANVEGGRSKPYRVCIELTGQVSKVYIDGICTCPMSGNCKHVVATLLEAIDWHEMEQVHREETTINASQNTQPTTLSLPKRDPQLDYWLNSLKETTTKKNTTSSTIDTTQSLRYVFYFPMHNKEILHLKLEICKILKSGTLGRSKSFQNYHYNNNFLSPIDQELLFKLEYAAKRTSSSYASSFQFQESSFEKLLPELLATNRCHYESTDAPTLTLGTSQKATLMWELDNNNLQQLVFQLPDTERHDIQIFLIENPWYYNKKMQQIGRIEANIDAPIFKTLLQAPKIPPAIAEEVVDLLDEHYQFDNITRPKLFSDRPIETLTPIIRLRLLQTRVATSGMYNTHYKPAQEKKPVAHLTFDYQGTEVQWTDTHPHINLTQDGRVQPYKRNKKIENKALEFLKQQSLFPLSELYSYKYSKENANILHYFLLGETSRSPLEFTKLLPELRLQGWHIDVAPDYPYQIIEDSIEDWYSSIEEDSSGYDWFNLELGIKINNEKINLLPVLHQLLQTTHTKQSLHNTDTIFAPLSDGRYLPLPTNRIKNIVNVLVELYDNLSEDGTLRLSKLHATRLLELEAATGAAQLRWHGGEKLRKLAEKLTHFKGIESVPVPTEFHGELRPYQLDGLNWLQFLREHEFSGILADDMGLGKTIQALCHLAVEKAQGRMQKPSLIIAPTSLMFNWFNEARQFVPHLKTLVLHGPQRKIFFEKLTDYDVIFTTYPLLAHDKEILLKQEFYFLILDEAQCIKNSKSLATLIAQQLKAQHRLCLTGTPMENHLGELWSLFHFMMPGLLGHQKTFNQLFRTPIEKQSDQERRLHLNRRIAPFLLRRTKAHVVKELPEKINMLQTVELEDEQRDLYETIRVTMQEKIRKEIKKLGFARSHLIILDALLKLRQICCDPRLLKVDNIKKHKAKSAKLELLMTLLPEMLEEGRRILLFSQFTEMLALIESELTQQKIPYVILTGQTKDRATPIQQFQQGEVPLFLISLKAGGTGLNLTAADTVIHYDPWWNPAVEDQATDRAHRIGQDKTVFVYKFVTKGTVEEKILEMQQHKRALMEGLFSENNTNKSTFTEQDLHNLFQPLS